MKLLVFLLNMYELTGFDLFHYEARTAKASMIHNPVFRYIHRAMACTIFGRGNGNSEDG